MNETSRMTTLKDISRASGFSVTTVSRALNGFGDVTADTRDRIAAVAREMNYRPNQIARKLVTGKSGMVGLVLEAPPQPFEHGHFFELVAGLSRAFAARDVDFILHVGTGNDVLSTHLRMIDRGTLDGFVVTFPLVEDARIDLLLDRDVPFVVHGHRLGDDRYAYFDLDNHAVSVEAVRLLAGLGHRRIALLAGPERWPSVAERVRGYREALGAAGLPADPALIRYGDTSTAYGAQAAAGLFGIADRPTAIVACNSLVAAGVYAAARLAGLRTPADVSVVAHDDALPQIETARMEPPLTVTCGALRDAAEPLADLLARRIVGEPLATLQITQGPELIVRASTARATSNRTGSSGG